jgi:hypothetical protein
VQASEAAKQPGADCVGSGRPRPTLRTETAVSSRWYSASVACSRAGRKTEQMACPAVRDDALQVLPLLLERLGKAGVGGLGVPPGHLCEQLDAPDPLCNLGLEPLGKGRLGAKEAADVSTTVDKLEAEGFELLLGPRCGNILYWLMTDMIE